MLKFYLRYMRNFCFYKKSSIYYSFIGSLILEFMCSFLTKWYFQPSWGMMSLIYWMIVAPKQVSIGTGFILGLIIDCIFNSILGSHALSFSIISYLIARKFYFFKNISVLQQSFFIIFFSLIDHSFKLLIIFIITKAFCSIEFFWNCILDGTIWPFLLFLMRRIYLNQ